MVWKIRAGEIAFLLFFAFSLFFSFFLFCSKKPSWIENPYKFYPSEKFLVGVGSGYNLEAAKNSAREEIAKQIKSKVTSKFEELFSLQKEKMKYYEFSVVEKRIITEVDEVLEGVIIKETWQDKNIWYALAILDKEKTQRNISARISEVELSANLNIKNFNELLCVDFEKAYKELKSAEEKMESLKKDKMLLSVISGKNYPLIPDELVNSEYKLKTLNVFYDETSFDPITSQKLQVYFRFKDCPAVNLPVKFDDMRTDKNGKIEISLPLLREGKNELKLSTPVGDFSVFVNGKKGNFKVLSKYSELKEVVENCLKKMGHNVYDEGEILASANINYSKIYEGKDFNGNPLFIYKTNLNLEISKGESKFLKNFEAKGTGKTDEEAFSSSYLSSIRKICGIMGKPLKKEQIDKAEIGERKKGMEEGKEGEEGKKEKIFEILGEKYVLTQSDEYEIKISVLKPAEIFVNGERIWSGIKEGKEEGGRARGRMITARMITGRGMEGRGIKISHKVRLHDGKNRIVVSGISDGEYWEEVIEVVKGRYREKFYIVSIGISQYLSPDMRLEFASNDAENFLGVLDGEKFLIKDSSATRENILKTIYDIAERIEKDSTVIIFVAGHGFETTTGSYFFATYDSTPENINLKGLNWADFNEMIKILKLSAKNVIIILDTCFSGSYGLKTVNLAEKTIFEDGIYILSSSSPGEVSYEDKKIKGGIFTYSLIKGIQGEADFDKDGYIKISEIFQYVSKETSKLTQGKQNPYFKISGRDIVIVSIP